MSSKNLCGSVAVGGVVVEMFRDLEKPTRFGGGGG